VWLNPSTNPEFNNYIPKSSNIVNTIGLIVAFIPEGLPPAVTLILTIVAVRMYRQKVLVKSLATLETFNSVSLIATDKTGTLTLNKMSIVHVRWGERSEWIVPQTSSERTVESPLQRTFHRVASSISLLRLARCVTTPSSLRPMVRRLVRLTVGS
jgi:P-type E1-E2 ATPase